MITESIPAYVSSFLKDLFSQNKKVTVHFRADDIGIFNKEQIDLLNLFIRYKVPLNLGIIPNQLQTHSTIHRNLISDHTDIFCLCQHGYQHINHSIIENVKYEFSKYRSITEQRIELQHGKDILKTCFNSDISSVFIPPWNYSDEILLKLLADLKYSNISIFRKDTSQLSLDMNVDLHTSKINSLEHYYFKLNQDIERHYESGYLGFMIHHNYMTLFDFLFLEFILVLCKTHKYITINRFTNQ